MPRPGDALIETERLRILLPTVDHADHYFALWRDPRVMTMVGFPEGLPITRDEIVDMLRRDAEQKLDEYDRRLVVQRKRDGALIGEGKLARPDEEGVAGTDVKLLPAYWGHRYGVEVKQALVDHLFTHTDARWVKGEPNKQNVASIRMQEAVGGIRVGEGLFEAPADSEVARCDVSYYEYRVDRETWRARREDAATDR